MGDELSPSEDDTGARVVQGKRRDMGLGRARKYRGSKLEQGHGGYGKSRDCGDPFAAREQLCRMRHSEVTQAVNETLELLRKAGVVINDVILSKLGVS